MRWLECWRLGMALFGQMEERLARPPSQAHAPPALAKRRECPEWRMQKEMINEGVEPATLALLAPRSNQLS